MKLRLICGAVMLTLSPSSPKAQADLAGQSGTAQYDFPAIGTVFSLGPGEGTDAGPVSFTAPSSQVDLLFEGFGDVLANTITDSGIDIAFLQSSSGFSPASFDGEVFTFPNFTITGIGVSENYGARVSHDAHNVYVDLGGLGFENTASFVDISVSGNPSSTPEPSSLPLVGVGLFALGLVIRKQFC